MKLRQIKYIKKKYHTVETVPKSNHKIANTGKIETPNTHMAIPPTFLAWYRHFHKKGRGLKTSFFMCQSLPLMP